ncbi:MAG TPA: ATP-dependent sacrificial sulfur transferase LarE [Propionibacterium sp.]|nr:ATP-dependent sacrificial sulfur transferase LarE [Propionibacterium sp.]
MLFDRVAAAIVEGLPTHGSTTGRLGVAYSGGVDSATLLAVAVRTLGADRVVALLGISPSLAASERALAHRVADNIGAEVVELETHEGARAGYVANGPDRCFHCKDELFSVISDSIVDTLGLVAVAYGENADDARRPDRPGSRAAAEHGVLRPLAAAGVGKEEVRALAHELGLAVADKPAAPCLASRIPHHSPVTAEKLRQVEQAEAAVRAVGVSDCRVRHHGEIARIEVPVDDLALVVERREDVLRAVRSAGFRFVALDLAGIQSGAFTLPLVQLGERRG